MQKISLNINVNKINKSKIVERTYTNNEGEEVTVKELKLDVVPLKQEKLITTKDDRELYKVGFVAHPSIKKEDGTWENGETLGDALEWRNKHSDQQIAMAKIVEASQNGVNYVSEDVNLEDIPF